MVVSWWGGDSPWYGGLVHCLGWVGSLGCCSLYVVAVCCA